MSSRVRRANKASRDTLVCSRKSSHPKLRPPQANFRHWFPTSLTLRALGTDTTVTLLDSSFNRLIHISSFLGILFSLLPLPNSRIQIKRAYGSYLSRICGTCTNFSHGPSTLIEEKYIGRYARSSMGWDPPSKKQELFHRDSRFVITRCQQTQDRPDSPCAEPDSEIPIMAYSMFRFDMEDGGCVLYWYSRLSNSS